MQNKIMNILYTLDAPAEKVLTFTFETLPKVVKKYSFATLEFLYNRAKPAKKKHHIYNQPRNAKGEVQSTKPNGERGNLDFSYYKKKDENKTLEFEVKTIEKALKTVGINQVRSVGFKMGPTMTTYAFDLTDGLPSDILESSKLKKWQGDLAYVLRLSVGKKVSIVDPKNVWSGRVAFEVLVDNEESEKIELEAMLTSKEYWGFKGSLVMAIGGSSDGYLFVDLAKLPHLLVAGTTGGGKSVGLNGMILSLMHGNRPSEVKIAIIDPAGTEFNAFNNSAYLYGSIATNPSAGVKKLGELVDEMKRRLNVLKKNSVKNIDEFNKIATHKTEKIVVVIDELYYLMENSSSECERSIMQLASVARKTGIHLIVATQRPSVEVVTGVIKANLPTRLSYKVATLVDSKVILDEKGAEKLKGNGDAYFKFNTEFKRTQAPFISERRLKKVVI